ncbi:hypothetical protein [Brachybacterium paraconglomeratum]|uniref:hypothetical protein n=1 Tax=Brachybacterium paraconglomeratum TaxID=173362 RepID=UPI0022AECB1F|nr:hypothetical protein [Brachybacterium paraconglomeratum]MCZ4326749.1 hypothetical protein [Brachybacterium paraconglomeratum]
MPTTSPAPRRGPKARDPHCADRRSAARLVEDDDGYVILVRDLYHRTTAEAADEILRSGRFISQCQDRDHVYFTDNPAGSRSRQYGPSIVHVVVPAWAAMTDESYGDETYIRVDLAHLTRCRILEVIRG